MRKLQLLLVLFFANPFAWAQNTDLPLRQVIQTKGQAVVQFVEKDPIKLKALSREISIDNVKEGLVTAYLSERQIDAFLEHQYPYSLLQNRAVNVLNLATTVSQMSNWDRYPTYSVYLQMMQNFVSNYPNLCRLDTIGYSQNGRLILALKITDNPDDDEFEPEFYYSGTMHGDEITGFVLLLRLADYLLSQYASNPDVADLVNQIEIWISPDTNPDGTYYGGDNNISSSRRYAANGVDLNRNFPNPVEGDHPDGSSWPIETTDMMNFLAQNRFTMGANTHGGAEVVNYPWDSWESVDNHSADSVWWQMISHEYANLAKTTNSSYLTDVENSGVTNGADWYYVFGSRQDYVNYYHNGRELTLELSSDKQLSSDELPTHWVYNRDAMLALLEQAKYGFRGIVSDACTGTPIAAKIELIGHDRDNSFVYSELPLGNFHRPVYGGTYTVQVSANGYQTQTFNTLSVVNYGSTDLNVQLSPLAPTASLSSELIDECSAAYILTNTSGGGSTCQWTIDGQALSNQNIDTLWLTHNGTYDVQITVQNCSGSDTESQNIVVDQLISAPTASDVARCGQGDITLTATANSNGILQWFDAPSGQLLDTGMSFTNNLTQTTNFWVNEQKYVQLNGGKLDQSGTGANYTLSTSHGQIFSVTEPLTLKSVKVYANGQANRTISLTNQSNQIIYSQSFNIPNGESRVELNWDIPVGTDYTLKAGAAPNLYRNGSSTSAQLPYPYQIGNVLQITGNTASNSRYYYFFYDWEIEYVSCVSPLTQVTASVNPNPTANFSFSDLGSFSYQFTNLSTDYTSLLWHFGDGQTSTEVNPLHNYANSGNYTVSLDATNDCGTITSTQNITTASIENHALQMVKAYPNPTNDYLYIEHRSGYNSIICNIFDIRGQLIHEQILNSNTTKIATDQWASGIYTIRLVSGYDTQWLRVVK